MDRERWQQIEATFQSALELEPDKRPQYLDSACEGDPELLDEVQTLLIASEKAGDFMDVPALKVAALLNEAELPSLSNLQALGPYRIISHIATGGMGEVYLAQDSKLDRKVALKILAADYSRDKERIRRFRQEAKAVSALNHPNIITIYDIGEEAGIHYIATEFVEGNTVRERLRAGRLPLDEVFQVVSQTASALQAAHRAGIAHRDIKPENIMVRPDGYVKVLDFGLAKLTEGVAKNRIPGTKRDSGVDTDPGVVMGTARYMSPEQARGWSVDARSDIFSLGIVLYEMISGETPFKGETPMDAVADMLESQPAPLKTRTPDVPAGLQSIVDRALRKEKEDRYQSTDELLADLSILEVESTAGARGLASGRRPPVNLGSAIRTEGGEGRGAVNSGESSAPSLPSYPMLVSRALGKRRWLFVGLVVLATAAIGYMLVGTRNKGRGKPPLSGSAVAPNSIAVLAFVNASGADSDSESLSQGLTEDLIDRLSRLSQLSVTAENSVLMVKQRQETPEAAGRDLDVGTVVSGQMVKSGDKFSINVGLLDVKNNKQIWTREYAFALADVLTIEEELARDVSVSLFPQLSDQDLGQLAQSRTQSPEAYIFYCQGRFLMSQRKAQSITRSIDLFNRAIEKDGSYAAAYASLGDAYTALADYGAVRPSEALQRAQDAVVTALTLDDTLADAHTTLGHLKLYYYREWANAESELRHALKIDPHNAAAHHIYGNYYAALGRFGEAMNETVLASQSDPLSPILAESRGFDLYLAGQYNAAIEQLRATLDRNPDFVPAHAVLGMVYLEQGAFTPAIEEFGKCVDLSHRSPTYLEHLGRAYAVAGLRDKAVGILSELKTLSRTQFVPSLYLARVYCALGQNTATFEAIDKAYDERDSELVLIMVDPAFANLHNDKRFGNILTRMHLDRAQ
jgi:serine/threonine protein kinase/tetratricopeptide (TPR) repeat protein